MLRRSGNLLLLVLLLSGCAPRRTVEAVPSPATAPSAAPTPSPAAISTSAVPFTITEPPITPAPSQETVTIAAVKGNLYIRRGPDMAFNPIGVLSAGQSQTALARDVLGEWVQVALPGNPAKTGWVSIQTIYSAVSGDIGKLPEVEPTDWPEPAFLRNCTFHNMTAEPGGIPIPALSNFPANDVRVNPGTYRIYDYDLDDYPEVMKVELREGSAIDIRVDGNGDKRKCPEP